MRWSMCFQVSGIRVAPLRYSKGRLALNCMHRHLTILPSRVPDFLAPERLQQLSQGDLDLLKHGAARGFDGPFSGSRSSGRVLTLWWPASQILLPATSAGAEIGIMAGKLWLTKPTRG